jgi:hypothetical protein
LLEGTQGNKDRYRLLEKHEREEMLALNYQYTIDYLKNGLGCQQADSEKQQEIVVGLSTRCKFIETRHQ